MPALETIAVVAKEAATTAVEVGGKAAEVTVEEAKEITAKGIETAEKAKDVVAEKLSDIKSMSPEQLREQMEKNLSETDTDTSTETDEGTQAKEGLTDEQKQRIKEETGWSDEIIDAIGSWQEYEIYKKAGLANLRSAYSDYSVLRQDAFYERMQPSQLHKPDPVRHHIELKCLLLYS